jgi:predicted Zn-dependent peptidase
MNFHKQTLANGVRLITVPMADNPSVTVLVMVETGSKYETKDISGISHFLEHMLFKGTPRRPKASDVSRELDSIGAHYNAFTTQEFTGYYAKAATHHLDAILDIISDIYLNPLFDQNEIRKEKGVIVEEMRMYQDLPQRHVQDVLIELLYGDQPAGWSVLGTEASVNALTAEQIRQYRTNHYVSSATTVIVAGSFKEKDIVTRVEKAFSAIKNDAKKDKVPVRESQSEPRIRTVFKDTDQTHLTIALRTFAVGDPRIPVMNVLATILGGGMSSRLFSRMRDELGICYYVNAAHDASTDHGDLVVSAGVDNSRVREAVKEILAECRKLIVAEVPAAELKKVKDYIAGTTMLELETSDSRAEFYGLQEVMKHKVELPAELVRKITAVTAAEVQQLAREIFVNKGLNLALIGKTKEEDLKKEFSI